MKPQHEPTMLPDNCHMPFINFHMKLECKNVMQKLTYYKTVCSMNPMPWNNKFVKASHLQPDSPTFHFKFVQKKIKESLDISYLMFSTIYFLKNKLPMDMKDTHKDQKTYIRLVLQDNKGILFTSTKVQKCLIANIVKKWNYPIHISCLFFANWASCFQIWMGNPFLNSNLYSQKLIFLIVYDI